MKIYFAGSIRGGRDDAEAYFRIIKELQKIGDVLTEHVGDEQLLKNEVVMSDVEIFERDMKWLESADLICAEVTQPSLGVGYELAMAKQFGKKVLCLFNESKGSKLSAMITGDSYFRIINYTTLAEIVKQLKQYINADN